MKISRRSILFFLVVSACMALLSSEATAQPCYSGFQYRVPVELDNSKSALLKSYEVSITLNTSTLISSGKMRSLGQDIRFLDRGGNELSYWIEDGTINKTNTVVWVNVDSIKNYAKDTIYLFYGNSTATAKSDASNTFQVVDEFNGSTLSSANWSTCGSGTVALSGGKLKLTSNSNAATIKTKTAIEGPLLVEMFGVASSGGTAILSQLNTSNDGYAMVHNGSSMQLATTTFGSGCHSTSGFGSTNSTGINGDWSFIWSGVSQIANWAGQTLSANNSSYSMGNTSYVSLANSGSFGTLEVDYLRIRKYSAIEPTVSIGSEQNINFSLNATYVSPLCAGGDLELTVNQVVGAKYSWSGPNGYKSALRNPQITGVSTSDAGRYDLTVEIPSGCASKSTSVNVNVSPKAVGGTISGSQTVCSKSNSGVISLSGHTGNVVRWDSATSATGPWVAISNTALNQNYSGLVRTTYFRAMVGNGNCSIDSSSVAKITVTPPSYGGTLSGVSSVCAGSNSGNLTVSGYTGNIVKWETSANGNLWTPIVNKGTSQSYSNISQTTYYRVAVQNGNCNIDYSNTVKITVDKATVGGAVSGGTTVCPDANNGYVILNGNTGSIVRWEMATTGSSLWTPISNTSDTLEYKDLKNSLMYRAVVKNGSCNVAVSSTATVTVLSASNAGSISGAKEVCETGNSGTLTLTSAQGNVLKWQSKTKSSSWTDIYSTKSAYDWYNLADTTTFRAIVSNSGCKSDTSSETTVYVNPQSDGGYVSGPDEVCSGINSATMKANATVGSVEEWQTSSNGYAPWTPIAKSNAANYTVSNLTSSLYFRTKVKSGMCASTYSDTKAIKVAAVSSAGSVVSNLELCEGVNFGIIKVTGVTGDVVKWQSSNSATGNWTDQNITTETYEVQNVSDNVYLRAIVKNGVCSSDTSMVAIVEVSKKSDAGNIYGLGQWCSLVNSGTIEVKDVTGDVLYWQSSTNNGSTWNDVVTNSKTYNYQNLTSTTQFRAVVRNGVCAEDFSQIAMVEVSAPSDAGTLLSNQTEICSGSNFGSIQVVDLIGNVETWESFDEVTNSWVSTQNNAEQQSYYNATSTLKYRVIVRNNFCSSDTSDVITINVSNPSVGGTISGDDEACKKLGTSVLQVKDFTGNIGNWQSSGSTVGPWTDLSETSNILGVDNLGESKYYRVSVKNGVCPVAYSPAFKHTIYNPTKGGAISGSTEVCTDVNGGVLELINFEGDIIGWEEQNENGSWTALGFSGDLYWYENLTKTKKYRVAIQNGVCDMEYSELAQVVVNPLPQPSFDAQNLCESQLTMFTDKSTISSGNVSQLSWMFSDGYTTTESTFNKVFQSAGKYEVTLTASSDKQCSQKVTQEVIISETPKALFRILDGVTPQSGCKNESVSFEDLTLFSNTGDLDYVWDFGNGQSSTLSNPIINFNESGNYEISLTTTSRTNCIDTYKTSYMVLDEMKPLAGDDIDASLGIGVMLNAKGSMTYEWSPAQYLSNPTIQNPVATVTESTMFIVTGTDYYGCKSSDSVWVNVTEDYRIIPNNVITPDGNDENDLWIVKNIENYPDNTVSVFDRWGREVFKTEGYANDWGATNTNGHLLMDGTYYYVIEFPENGKIMKGAITVVRNK